MKMRLVFILFVVAIAVADAFEGLGRLGMVGGPGVNIYVGPRYPYYDYYGYVYRPVALSSILAVVRIG